MVAVQAYTPSEWLAQRVQVASDLGPPVQPHAFALPGAARAIPAGELLMHQLAGRQTHEVVALINDEWKNNNSDRLAAHQEWTNGQYAEGIQRAREAAQRARAEELRRREVMERLIREAS